MDHKYSLEQLQQKAEDLAIQVEAPQVILLKGTLGTGKTTFSRFFIKKLAGDVTVSSPTFNIVQIYESPKGSIWHVDLYRLEEEAELEELGIFEACHNYICLIEWPEIIEGFLKNLSPVVIEL